MEETELQAPVGLLILQAPSQQLSTAEWRADGMRAKYNNFNHEQIGYVRAAETRRS